jgi:predicted AlkP superfamily pyrophosphatase or phosphodiesterase
VDIERVVDSESRPKRCIVIAIDGARRDYLERYEAPCMRKLAEEGVGFRNAIASNGLAETANGFTTIATGLTTSGHGVFTSREWYDRERNSLVYVYDSDTNALELNVPTAAERIKAHLPGTRVASISTKDRLAVLLVGMSADLIAYSYREHVFHRHTKGSYTGRGVTEDGYQYTERVGYTLPPFLQNIRTSRRVDWSGPGFNHPDQDTADTALIDRFIMDGALAIAEHFDPDILFVGLVAANIVGHKYGPESPEMAETFRTADGQIGRLVELAERRGTRKDTLFIVTSDHGMTLKPQGVDITKELRERFGEKLVVNILYTFAGSAGGLYLRDIKRSAIDEMVSALRQIAHIKGAWWKYDPEAPWFVKRMAHPHTADVLIIPDRDWVIFDPGVSKPNVIAHHGPQYPSDVNIVQIYNGPGIKQLGFIGEPLNLLSEDLLTEEEVRGLPEHRDVAPLMLRLFGAPKG